MVIFNASWSATTNCTRVSLFALQRGAARGIDTYVVECSAHLLGIRIRERLSAVQCLDVSGYGLGHGLVAVDGRLEWVVLAFGYGGASSLYVGHGLCQGMSLVGEGIELCHRLLRGHCALLDWYCGCGGKRGKAKREGGGELHFGK